MKKTEASIWLSPADRATLGEWVSGRNTPQKVVWRARIVLLSADRVGVMAIARSVGKSKVTVSRWQERYLAKGIAGLRRDASRPGRKPPLSATMIERVVHKTLHEKPAAGTHWSIRKMAAATRLSYSSVQRIWQAHELKPHLVKTFKLSNDKRFVEKVQDIVGLYLDPPEKALVSLRERAPCFVGYLAVLAVTGILACPSGARAANVAEGNRLAERLCSQCHVTTRDGPAGWTDAPSFATIADKPTTTSASLQAFIQKPHMDMFNLARNPAEAADLAAFILSLKQK